VSTPAIRYRRRATPLHAARATAGAAYAGSLAFAALLVENPILLGALLAAVLGAAAGAGVLRGLVRAARRMVIPIVLLTVIVNLLVSRQGLTVFARLGEWGVLGQVNLTVEALVYGLVFALRLIVVSLACLLGACAVDPDELLFACRRVSPHSALTAALSTRLIPVLAQDAARLSEAQRCRPDGGARGARGRASIVRATVSGALDRSMDVAAVLEMRGYGAGRGPRGRAAPASRHDAAFLASAVLLVSTAIAVAASGIASFSAYPLVSVSAGPEVFAAAALLVLLALLPFSDRRGIER
jgi:energy-coupling factor transport system permease protein